MIDHKKKAELDQEVAAFNEIMPGMWMGLFRSLKGEGFTEIQALELLKTYITSTFGKT